MHSTLLFTVPTVGHLNSAIALAKMLETGGWRCDIVTGSQIAAYASALTDQIPGNFHCLPSFDLNFDRSDPQRRSHFEQVFEPAHVLSSTNDIRRLIAEIRPKLVITKDYMTPRLCAVEARIASAVYMTDGVEPLILKHRLLKKEIKGGAEHAFERALDEVGLKRFRRPVQDRTTELRLARGYRRTSLVPFDKESLIDDVVFLGSLVFDGAPETEIEWRDRLAALKRPMVYITFGTVNADSSLVRRAAAAAAKCAESVVVTHLPGWEGGIDTPTNVLGASYIPNAAALATADVMIHHGGHGSMLSALSNAVPSVVFPLNTATSAQGLHAEMLGILGVGQMLPVDAEQPLIEAAVRRALEPEVRQRSSHLRAELTALDRSLQAGALAEIDRFVAGARHGSMA